MIVYKTTNTVDSKIYVGATARNVDNLGYLGSGPLILTAIKEFGRDKFTRETLETCSSLESLQDREKYWIKELNSNDLTVGYNTTPGGENSTFGMKMPPFSEKSKKLMSEAKMGKKQGSRSEETRRKMSLAMKGKKKPPVTEETREKLRQLTKNSWTNGRKLPSIKEETKEKLSLALKLSWERRRNHL